MCFHTNHNCFICFLCQSSPVSWVCLSYQPTYAQILEYTIPGPTDHRYGNQMNWCYSHLLHDKFTSQPWPCSLVVTKPDPWRMLTTEEMDIRKQVKTYQGSHRSLMNHWNDQRLLPSLTGYLKFPSISVWKTTRTTTTPTNKIKPPAQWQTFKIRFQMHSREARFGSLEYC